MNDRAVWVLWKRSLSLAVLSAYLLVLVEWVFQITRPSFFSALQPGEALSVLLVAPLPLVSTALALSALTLPLLLAARRLGARDSHLAWIAAVLPAMFLAALLLLWVDSFGYTMFGWGITSLRSAWRLAYGAAFTVVLFWIVRFLARKLLERGSTRVELMSAGVLVGFSCLALVAALVRAESPGTQWGDGRGAAPMGDVLLISGDAFEAAEIPRYGKSPPSRFRQLLGKKNTVTFENHLPNAGRTAATIPVALTGKYATTTGKFSETTYFWGQDAYEHLPGLLRAYGYESIQIGDPPQVDAVRWRMKDAFDALNDRQLIDGQLSPDADHPGLLLWPGERLGLNVGLESELGLSGAIIDRIVERMRHIYGAQMMARPHLLGRRKIARLETAQMRASLESFLDRNPGPVFVQLHSLITRAGGGTPGFYQLLERIVQKLRDQGRFEDAMIVVWSDHGKRHTQNRRLPFIIKFPAGSVSAGRGRGSASGRISNPGANTQTLDIAPTVLEVLGIPIPEWMEGRSLFVPLDPYEPIFSTFGGMGGSGLKRETERGIVRSGLRRIGMTVCQRWYALDVFIKARLETGGVVGHTAPCPRKKLPGRAEARAMMVEHLMERGYAPGLAEVAGLDLQRGKAPKPMRR